MYSVMIFRVDSTMELAVRESELVSKSGENPCTMYTFLIAPCYTL